MSSSPKSYFSCENIVTKAILFFFGCLEVNSTWLITSELANQRVRKVLFTSGVYTNKRCPSQSYSKMYGIEPQYNKLFDVTNIICKPKHKIYLDITNYSVNTRQRINAEQIHDGKSGAVRKSNDSRVPSCQWRTHFWRCKPKDRGNLHWKNSFIKHKLLLVKQIKPFWGGATDSKISSRAFRRMKCSIRSNAAL